MPLKLIPPEKIKGAKNIYIRGTHLRVRVFQSSGTDKPALARKERERIEREIEEGRYAAPAAIAPPTFSDAALGYLKECGDSEVPRVQRLLPYFRDTLLADFKKDVIDEGEDHFYPGRLTKYAASTLNREYRSPLAAVLHHAAERELMHWVKVAKYRERQTTRWLEPEAAMTLLQAAEEVDAEARANKRRRQGTHLAALLVTLFTSAFRISEATGLTWAMVNLQRREFGPLRTKNGDEYVVHTSDLAFEAISNLPEFDANGKRIPDAPIFGFRNRDGTRCALARACEKAGMVKRDAKGNVCREVNGRAKTTFNHHMARHSFATWIRRQEGMDLKKLMELGRWKSVQSVARYAHVSADEHAPAIAKLPLNKKAAG